MSVATEKGLAPGGSVTMLRRLRQIVGQEGCRGLWSRLRYRKRRVSQPQVTAITRNVWIAGHGGFATDLGAALSALGHPCLSETALRLLPSRRSRFHIDPDLSGRDFGHDDILVLSCPVGDPVALLRQAGRCHSIIETRQDRMARWLDLGIPAGKLFLIGRKTLRRDLYRFLLATGTIGADDADWRRLADLHQLPKVPRLCLSLPETPLRQGFFLQQDLPGFRLVAGIRRNPGWIGAGVGFRMMARACLAARVGSAILCEDDLIAGSDFEDRLEGVLAYLDQTGWDVFSGLSTDIDASYRVTAVQRFRGQTFVHLNRTTGMVFNIFSPRALDWLARWSPARQGVPIDRHLEAMPRMRVVTTLPFLVDHADGLESSAWGFSNRRYRSLIAASESRLARMVAAFEASGTPPRPVLRAQPRARVWYGRAGL